MVAPTLAQQAPALPRPRSGFVGREAERLNGRALILEGAVPLLTLTGPGGVGKTRLALAIGHDMASQFVDGAIWIDLSPVTDQNLVVNTIAAAIEVSPVADIPLIDEVLRHLHNRQILLLIDNCEHVIMAASAAIATLLAGCPALQVLATSRAPLRLRGEQVLPVDPLPLPAIDADLAAMQASPAVALFVQRSGALTSRFALTAENAGAVRDICRRLDGLPLAIELAAGRSNVLTPAALLAQFSQRLSQLGPGARDAPARQQTMRDAIAWSYGLLDADTRRFFRRLAVFAGGFDIESAAIVGNTDPLTVVADLELLIDQSLILRDHRTETAGALGQPRFRMLETIREIGLELLIECGEYEQTRDAHAARFLRLSEQAERHLFGGPDQPQWLDRLEVDHDNLRAAFDWSAERWELSRCLQLGAALWVFWVAHGHWNEGRTRLRRALQSEAEDADMLRVAVRRGLAAIEFCLGNFSEMTDLLEATMAADRRTGDKGGVAHALYMLGLAARKCGDLESAATYFEESLALYRDVDEHGGCPWCYRRPWCARSQTAVMLGEVAYVAFLQGDDARAVPLLEQALRFLREMDDQEGSARVLRQLGEAAQRRGDHQRAAALFAEALQLYRGLGMRLNIANALLLLGDALRHNTRVPAASLDRSIECFDEALSIFRERDDLQGVVSALLAQARCAEERGNYAGSSALAEEALRLSQDVGDEIGMDEALALIRTSGSPATAENGSGDRPAAPFIRSRELVPDQASSRARSSSPASTFDLTRREREILELLCQRLTNMEIAAQLFISPKTTENHVGNILNKLGAPNRREAAAIAVRNALV
ncbi:MAG: tetratricopeptide repeat protein [Thermomicrobiales bacterium]